MKLFNGNEKLKDELIKEIKAHQKADEYIQSEWYNKNTGKGCHYGCIMQTDDNPREKFAKKYSIDLWYVNLTEIIFEGLPKGEFENYPLTSIEVFLKDGKLPKTINWNKIKSEFFYKLLDDQLKYCKDSKDVTDYVKKCRDLFVVPFNEIDRQEATSVGNFVAYTVSLTAAAAAAVRAAVVADAAAVAAAASANAVAAAASAVRAAVVADAVAAAASANAAAAAVAAANAVAAAVYAAKKNHYIWIQDLLFKCVKNNITF